MGTITQKITFTADVSMRNKYYFVPFDVPENVETLTLDFCYKSDKKVHPNDRNKLDVALVAPDGKQVGATGQKIMHIVVSERYSTQGYHPMTPPAGKWQLLIGVAGCEEKGLTADFIFHFTQKQPRWLKGDTHIHTYHSDGAYTPETIFKKLKKKKFDYAIITDHNVNMAGQYYRFPDPDLLVINGYELTSFNGHVNFWGVQKPLDLPFGFNTPEEYKERCLQAKQRGCTISINHLTCKNCGWQFWATPEDKNKEACQRILPDDITFDCCEVWNGPMRIDNVTAVEWWHKQLLTGWRLPAVGGSDYHQNYVGVNLLGNPTTHVYAKSNTTEDILDALKNGRSFITHSPTSTEMYLQVEDKNVGENIPWKQGLQGKIVLKKPKRGHRLVVYNNDKIVFDKTLSGKREEEYVFDVPEKGFVRAEIRYRYNLLFRSVYKAVIPLLMPKEKGLPIPDFYWALTNPVWVE
ncbi:MAG: PHP domain-containing protein [Clostridia bacterium]|nr:PHP domain-containing protein [Clostridia bacterium]